MIHDIKNILKSIKLDLKTYTTYKDKLINNNVLKIYTDIEQKKEEFKINLALDNKLLDDLEFNTMKTNIKSKDLIENKQEQINKLTKNIIQKKKIIYQIKIYKKINDFSEKKIRRINKIAFKKINNLYILEKKKIIKNILLKEYLLIFFIIVIVIFSFFI